MLGILRVSAIVGYLNFTAAPYAITSAAFCITADDAYLAVFFEVRILWRKTS
jgi:hypothetical protein